ncbi:MAG: hypothetical protein HYV07_20465 [Deltaproteobacteria bacterium]|nr:hypothetical protein [Deltaproteobacteria bacterium]
MHPSQLAFGAIFVASLLGCRGRETNLSSAPAADGARRARIFFSTSVLGYIEPCGCTSKPLGGVQRLATIIDGSTVPHILVDAGNLFFPDEREGAALAQHDLKATMLARVYRRLGAVAINVGPSDLEAGPEFLARLQAEGAVPLVSANVRPEGRGPEVALSFIREVGGIRVGITGVADLGSTSSAGLVATGTDESSMRVSVREPMASLRAEIEQLRTRGAELVLVLSHLGENGSREIARSIPGIDVVVRAPGAPIVREPSAPELVGSVAIVEAGSQGQRIGVLEVSLKAPNGPIVFDDGGMKAKRQKELETRKRQALEREIAELSKDPARAEAVAARKVQLDRLTASLESASSTPLEAPRRIKYELISLTTDVASHAEMSSLLDAYYARLRDLNLDKGDRAPCVSRPDTVRYIGTDACLECHETQHAFWKTTKHAKAWATLENDNKHFDLTCIGCHTVGYQRAGGFCTLRDVGVLKDVGCEMCHGPGARHAETKDTDHIQLTVTRDTCAKECHVPEHSDTFEFARYVRSITGPGHELSETSSASLRSAAP